MRAKRATNAGEGNTLSRIAKIRSCSLSNSALSQGERKSAIPLSWERGRGEGNSSFAQQTETNFPSYRPSVLTTFKDSAIADHATLVRNDEKTLVPQYLNALVPYKKVAFTLAEVLITLGIIGVVAAMTMPTLIQNHRKSVVETKLAKFYSVMNQAVQRAEADYGDKRNWETLEAVYEENEDGTKKQVPNTEYFNKYFAPYLNNVKIDASGAKSSRIRIYFPDGSAALFSHTSIIFSPSEKELDVIDDGSGKLYYDTTYFGTKYFTFHFAPNSTAKYHYNKGVEPYKVGWDGTNESLLNNSALGCRKENVSTERAYCTALIQMNGWKIPKDYPLRF